MGAKSRRKGKQGELDLVRFLRTAGFDARRGQQFKGTPDSPDVVVRDLPGLHWECKRAETFSVYPALEQAVDDAGGALPVVAHRRSRREWIAVLRLEDLLNILRESEFCRPGGDLTLTGAE